MYDLLDLTSLPFIEELYASWLRDPSSVDGRWQEFFSDFDQRGLLNLGTPRRGTPRRGAGPASADIDDHGRSKQSRVDSLLWAYRDVGYFYAYLNPLRPQHEPSQNYLYPRAKGAYEQLSIETFGLSEHDLDREFSAGRAMKPARARLKEILRAFQETYCSTFGVEFLHIQNKPIRNWLLHTMESCRNRHDFSTAQRRAILKDLIKAEEFEQFLHKTFIGQKRFSLEGAEVVVPALHSLVDAASGAGIDEIVIGTAHRGRITILNQILNMPAEEIFTLFEDNHKPGQYGGSGDVKYHLGYSTDHGHEDGSSVHVTLVSNPSHLESVDGVVEGKTRAVQSQSRWGSFMRATKKVLPVILHGDAAFSGQGVVAEIFNLSQLRGYHTGGTIHVIINNQIGFTTSSRDSRSTFFPTDVAKMTSVPVFHVNGDDPEAVVYAMDLALRFRQKMSQDVIVDIVCYRRHGHNEGDEPSFTNPRMYKLIRNHPGVTRKYAETCSNLGVMSPEEQRGLRKEYAGRLRRALITARENPPEPTLKPFQGDEWQGLHGRYTHEPVPTGVKRKTLEGIAATLTRIPEDLNVHSKLKRIVEDKKQRLEQEGTMDWAFAESLSFGTLLLEGIPVRLSGQDCERGTFSQRHSAWWDTESAEALPYVPLNHLGQNQARFFAYDSPLSEYSILGFEYGFSLNSPRTLVIWEAQFGDFSNGAQVVIDNFIAAAQTKWQRSSGLVLLLPHGYEGQGPEHSSAHLERFLQLCAEENMEVCNLTTPAQYFHLLRRQMKRDFRKPLVLMSPKSLLRHPLAVSRLEELSQGHFQPVLDAPPVTATLDSRDTAAAAGSNGRGARRLILCSGKLYYDLWERRQEMQAFDTGILRVEQLYPFPDAAFSEVFDSYRGVRELIWAQEEPENRGALRYIREQFLKVFPDRPLTLVSRPASASPAVGSHRQHVAEQRELVDKALGVAGGATADAAEDPSTGSKTEKKPRPAERSVKRGKA
ncbi:MAG: 2-oxoglutarate dehydrogenase E1 component [Spirochaetaceae bacterium]|nr:MAG: 2-oxoglutarate dehydrogenase E1 component [Spirochaetaceae bacterium]